MDRINGIGASEFPQRTVGFGLGSRGNQIVQFAVAGILLDFRVAPFPTQFVKPAAQLSLSGFGQFQYGLLDFRYSFHLALSFTTHLFSHSTYQILIGCLDCSA